MYLVLFLTQEMKYTIVEAGQYIALSFLAGAAGRILWSMASDYFFAGYRKAILIMIALILFFSSLALGMISFFHAFSPLLLTAVLAYGVSGIGWNAIYLTLVGESVGRESTGLATGIGYFFGFMGAWFAPRSSACLSTPRNGMGMRGFFLHSAQRLLFSSCTSNKRQSSAELQIDA